VYIVQDTDNPENTEKLISVYNRFEPKPKRLTGKTIEETMQEIIEDLKVRGVITLQ